MMGAYEEQHLNKNQGTEERIPCLKCRIKTVHKVLLSVDTRGGDGNYDWSTSDQIIQCMGCRTISFRTASSNSEDYDYDEDGSVFSNVTEVVYPPRLEGRRGIDESIWYLPHTIRSIYQETLQALLGNSPVLTGIGLRALIEAVCTEKEAEGPNLYKKIDDMVAKRFLTPKGAEILHHIRTLGNDAAHEVKPHNESQLVLAMDVVEHLLKDVFILPALAKAAFKDAK